MLLVQPFWDIGEFGAIKYFTDHQIANIIQLVVAIIRSFFGFFSSTEPVKVKLDSPEIT